MELFYKKVYTVAFRLTGKEEIAEEMAVSAITKISKELNEDYIATENNYRLTIIELVKIFLDASISYKNNFNDNHRGIQNALLKLNPINRAVIIWQDVVGYKVTDNIPVENYSQVELYKALNSGRKELKDYFNNIEIHKVSEK